MTVTVRRKAVTLRPDDERRVAAAEEALALACDSADDAAAAVNQFVDDIESDRVGMDGVVLETVGDEDSLVLHIEDGLGAARRAQGGSRP